MGEPLRRPEHRMAWLIRWKRGPDVHRHTKTELRGEVALTVILTIKKYRFIQYNDRLRHGPNEQEVQALAASREGKSARFLHRLILREL